MPDRVDVALSRAGHGQRPAWKRFISSALEETTVVDPEYVNTIRLPNCQHDQRGRLVLAGDGVVRSQDFYMKWRGNNEGSRAGGSRGTEGVDSNGGERVQQTE
uniref:Uncharacterized protein n=1 Tax=Globodera pallida TaxID=36090 RepID=A0A183BRC4_GLOPA